ncbi:MAG: restriction endonuclease subunit S [Balneolaceae bacterium]|nr:restriction endonuclease subunit S [Balneolaceae bacterium]
MGLAVRGKLVPQDPNDEPASELLKKIETEKQRLYESGEIRKHKKLPVVDESEYFSNLPNNWFWTRLGEVGDWGAGATPSRGNTEYYGGNIPWLKTGELNDSFINKAEEYITKKGFKNSSVRLCKPGDVLIAMYGATIGKLGILNIEATTNQACCACTVFNGFYNIYLFYYLLAMREDFRNQGAGGAQPNISKTKIEHTVLPLPPLAEQHRIVAKIESLFAEVDELETKLEAQTKLDEKLQLGVNAEVQQAPDTEASKAAWNFITSNFETLYHTPESIDNLKKNILNEAVRGRLVPQDPNDEPASELLKKIEAEKQRLYEEGEIRKPKALPPVNENEIPFEIPESWEWCRLGETYGDIGTKTPDSKFSYLDVSSIDNESFKIDSSKVENIDSENAPSRARRLVKEGSVIYSTVRPYLLNVAIVNNDFDFEPIASTAFEVINTFQGVYNKYAYWYLLSTPFIEYVNAQMVGVAYPAINKKDMQNSLISIPPLKEQHRIVQRIEELFAICDAFKAKLEQHEKVNERLVKGLVQEVLEGV